MSEIKIYHDPIHQALGDFKHATDDFMTSFSKDMKGQNELDMVNKMHEINELLDKLQKSYQELALRNAETAGDAVKAIQEREQNVASSIKRLR